MAASASAKARKPSAGARASDPRNIAPAPIIDSFEVIGNPQHGVSFPLLAFPSPSGAPDGALRDYEAALKFLYSYTGSAATVNAYRRELERLLQWAWRIETRTALSLTRDDIENFVRFSISPPAAWIGDKNVARFRGPADDRKPNDAWRPFVISVPKSERDGGARKRTYQPSQASVRITFAALSSFYDYLTEETLVEANPVALIRQKSKFLRKDHNKAVVRRISNLQWDYVIETAEQMAAREPERHERTLFIMNCLFAMYLRISELVADERASPVMGDFRKDQDGYWWFHVTGKGNKSRTVTVSDAMLGALKRYRTFLGLSALPTLNDETPLVAKVKGAGPLTSTRQIRVIVQDCFDAAFARMKADGFEDDAIDLKAATVHWLRHTGISEDVKIRPREHVRDDAGHASMATTDRYIESDRRERHHSGRRKPLKDL